LWSYVNELAVGFGVKRQIFGKETHIADDIRYMPERLDIPSCHTSDFEELGVSLASVEEKDCP
jgi:hypothetical protein